MEKWKEIPGLNGRYLASDLGRIKSIDSVVSCHKSHYRKQPGKILKPYEGKNGYEKVTVFIDGKRKYTTVHRLVASAFIPNPKKKEQVNHKNGNRSDNRLCNLEWCTMSENIKHSFRELDRPRKSHFKGVTGKDHPLSKKIAKLDIHGNIIKIYDAMNDAKRDGFNIGNILSCCQGKRKSHQGYKWQYYSKSFDAIAS